MPLTKNNKIINGLSSAFAGGFKPLQLDFTELEEKQTSKHLFDQLEHKVFCNLLDKNKPPVLDVYKLIIKPDYYSRFQLSAVKEVFRSSL